MALSWNKIKDSALRFSTEWENRANAATDARLFLEGFFDDFGIIRKKKLSNADGYMVLFIKDRTTV